MKSRIQTNNVNSTELWVELSEQQSSELVGGTLIGAPLVNAPLVNAPINIGNDSVILDDADFIDQSGDSTILSGFLLGIFKNPLFRLP
jgi:hypothetical protein